ncbi:MAG: tripartite tricarboxylate transporter substrate binding protein [Proteobacteria bacterium]|nr:tripartite tricarboxylate transporter substrate binding protein [Pseudomonadota bacterium]
MHEKRACCAWRAALAIAGLAVLGIASPLALAQAAPRNLTLVVGATPGAGVDRTARVMADDLAQRLGRPVIVDDRPGAAGRIAADVVVRAAPDGGTVLFATAESLIDLAFDADAKPNLLADFVPIARVAQSPLVLVVRADAPWTSVDALIADARRRPGALNYATPGIKSSMHLVTELLSVATGARFVQIPFIGLTPAVAAVIGGQVDFAFVSLSGALPQIRSGQLRSLAVASDQRSALLPDVPTLAETGIRGVEGSTWYALFASRATPAARVDELARAVADVVRKPAIMDAFGKMGADPALLAPAELAARLDEEVARYRRVIQAQGVRAE